MNTALKPMYEWNQIPWRKLERRTFKLQNRIYRASNRGDVKLVRRLQKLWMKSWSAKCIAVRRVTQDNQGKKTAGVDGVKSLTPKQRLSLANELKLGTKVSPTRRVWIPKPGKDEKRPLGIPTMKDRALQALVKVALEPEWEARFEPNSYGFRAGRSCHDAIEAIYISINQKSKFVLDADIAKCFDRIDHGALLRKLNTFPTIRRQVRAWLQAGVMDKGQLFPTSEGTPQGGVISPLLANIALHGMENRIKEEFPRLSNLARETWYHKKGTEFKPPQIIRFADDFVILHEDITVVQRCHNIMVEWLKDIGLEMKPEKTRITHVLDNYEKESPGFDFLGFTIRQFHVGNYQSGKTATGESLGFKTVITPSKKSLKVHQQEVARITDTHRGTSQTALIDHLNPIIRGWANYYATVCSKECYSKLDHLMYLKLRAWANHRHPNKTQKWVVNKYWQTIDGDNWVFATRHEGKYLMRLQKYSATKIERHIKVKGEASPYDGNLVYWSARMGKHPEMPKRTASLLKKQKGKCAHCGLYFKDGDVIELDHIIPKSKGGKDEYNNWQLLHRHCHDTKTANDSSHGTQSGCNSAEPKPPINTNWFWVDDMLVMRYV